MQAPPLPPACRTSPSGRPPTQPVSLQPPAQASPCSPTQGGGSQSFDWAVPGEAESFQCTPSLTLHGSGKRLPPRTSPSGRAISECARASCSPPGKRLRVGPSSRAPRELQSPSRASYRAPSYRAPRERPTEPRPTEPRPTTSYRAPREPSLLRRLGPWSKCTGAARGRVCGVVKGGGQWTGTRYPSSELMQRV